MVHAIPRTNARIRVERPAVAALRVMVSAVLLPWAAAIPSLKTALTLRYIIKLSIEQD